jgi:uncharacterized membrane protein YphA (DoxX/SURF4 family)
MTTQATNLRGFNAFRHASSRLISIVLGCMFLLSGIGKVQNPYDFIVTLDQFQLVGPRTAIGIAIFLPFLELAIGACLVVGLAARSASRLATILLAVLVAALASVVYRGIHASCGCFGVLDSSDITWTTVARTGAFLAVAVLNTLLLTQQKTAA